MDAASDCVKTKLEREAEVALARSQDEALEVEADHDQHQERALEAEVDLEVIDDQPQAVVVDHAHAHDLNQLNGLKPLDLNHDLEAGLPQPLIMDAKKRATPNHGLEAEAGQRDAQGPNHETDHDQEVLNARSHRSDQGAAREKIQAMAREP